MSGRYQAYSEYKNSGAEWLRRVPSDWVLMQAKYKFLLQRGHDLSSDQMIDGAYLVYGSNGPIGKHHEFTTRGPSITVGRSGSVGEINYIRTEFWAHNTSLYLKDFKNSPPRFIYYLLKAIDPKRLSAGTAVGTLDRNNIHRQVVAAPTNEEAEIIANFLDHETTKIDTLLEKQQQLIKLLKEKRQAVISHAVTKGLNLNTPMRDSGVEWLGKVPEHWDEQSRIKYISSLKGRQGWQGLKADEYLDEGPYVVSSAHFNNHQIQWDDCPHVSPERYERDSNIQLAVGDLLLMKDGAAMGKLAYVEELPDMACLNSHLLLFRPIKQSGQFAYNSRFIYYFMQTDFFQEHIKIYGTGVTFLGISQQSIGNYRLVLPSLEDQKDIADFLESETSKLDKLSEKENQMKFLLQERRTALISAAVTGKIDVRKWQAPIDSRLRRNDVITGSPT